MSGDCLLVIKAMFDLKRSVMVTAQSRNLADWFLIVTELLTNTWSWQITELLPASVSPVCALWETLVLACLQRTVVKLTLSRQALERDLAADDKHPRRPFVIITVTIEA